MPPIVRPAAKLTLNEEECPVLRDPAGAINAERRGQSVLKYNSDFIRGTKGEWIAAKTLERMGMGACSPVLDRRQNKHEPDLAVDGHKFHVKTHSIFGGRMSWVFQGSAVVRDGRWLMRGDNHWFIGVWMDDRMDYAGAVRVIAPYDNALPLLRGTEKSFDPPKFALYDSVLGRIPGVRLFTANGV